MIPFTIHVAEISPQHTTTNCGCLWCSLPTLVSLFSAVATAVSVVDPMVTQTLLTPPTGHANGYSYVLLFFSSRGVLFTGQFSSPSLDTLVSTRGLSDFFDLCLQCTTLDHIHLAQSVEGFQRIISAFKLFNLQKERMQTQFSNLVCLSATQL